MSTQTDHTSKDQFSLGLRYWPRRRSRSGQIHASWADVDQGALRHDLDHIRELGCDTLLLELRWAEAQPGPARVGAGALRGLERALDAAHDRGLRAVAPLLAATLGGALHLPEWACGFRLPGDLRLAARLGPPISLPAPDQPAILAGDGYRREQVRDLYRDPELREAERYLLREAVANLSGHPALAGWLLAPGAERAYAPPSARLAGEWWAGLAEQARSLGAPGLYAELSPAALTRRAGLRPGAILASGGQLILSAAPLPPMPAQGADPIGFLYALAAGLVQAEHGRPAPLVVADIGWPGPIGGQRGPVADELFGRPAASLLRDEDEQAQLLEAALAGLWAAGAAGAWLIGYADPPPEDWSVPPLDRVVAARSWGIVGPGGREKPAAEALRRFAARRAAGALPAPAGPPALPLDPERYWHDPDAGLRDLWAEWQRR